MKIEEVKKRILPILKDYDVKKASLFGSLVREEENQSSDVDILIEFEEDSNKSLFDLAGLKIDLEEELGREVDVVTYNSLHPLLKDQILSERKAIL